MRLSFLRRGPTRLTGFRRVSAIAGFMVGGLLLIWSAGIHFHLWKSDGYRHIPTIGPLFVVQAITAVVLGELIIVVGQAWTAIVGAGFAASTVIGLVVTVERGLFGFRDSWSAPFATLSVYIEIAAVVALGAAAVLCLFDRTAIPNRVGDE